MYEIKSDNVEKHARWGRLAKLGLAMACGLSVLPAAGGTYTWTGAAAKFSAAGAFSEGTPPADDPSVVLDFSGMYGNRSCRTER